MRAFLAFCLVVLTAGPVGAIFELPTKLTKHDGLCVQAWGKARQAERQVCDSQQEQGKASCSINHAFGMYSCLFCSQKATEPTDSCPDGKGDLDKCLDKSYATYRDCLSEFGFLFLRECKKAQAQTNVENREDCQTWD